MDDVDSPDLGSVYRIRSDGDGVLVYEVKQVYIYIPSELSATGFELKIAGLVRIVKKKDENILTWDPEELSYQDVACLYSSESDGWTVIDDDFEPPEILDTHPYLYPTLELGTSEPIVSSKQVVKAGDVPKGNWAGVKVKGEEVKYTKDTNITPPSPDSPVKFSLSTLKCIRENTLRGGIHTLTFFLSDGKELPTLHFHDGGTSGLLQTLTRYLYLVRDGKDSRLVRVEVNPVIAKTRHTTEQLVKQQQEQQQKQQQQQLDVDILRKGVEGLLHTAVLEVGKRVRHQFRNSRDMLDERPSDDMSHDDEDIPTITCHDLQTKEEKAKLPDPDTSLITDFQLITNLSSQLPPRSPICPRTAPLNRVEWEGFRQIDGKITEDKEQEFRARVFAGGIEPSLRREVWKYLLGYFQFNATDIERMEHQKMRSDQYDVMKKQWKSFLPEQEAQFHKWRELKNLVEKDVIRTDRELEMYHSPNSPRLKQLQDILTTYVMYNFDLGYVQGMSDLLSPLLAVMDNEVDTFWCFVGLMKIVGHYFEETQEGMRWRIRQLRALLSVSDPSFYKYLKEKESGNLYFAFRWLLVDFKREFNFSDLMCIWEVLWTHHLSSDYALFIALAIIDIEKEKLQDSDFDFSDIIAHINGLSKQLSYEPILLKAESICRQIAAVQSLPDELQPLISTPFPPPHSSPVVSSQ